MKQATINAIKTDALMYEMGLPFVSSAYLTYNEEELKCWEDGILEAIEFLSVPVDVKDAGVFTDGDQEMDQALPVMPSEYFFVDCFAYLEECSCH